MHRYDMFCSNIEEGPGVATRRYHFQVVYLNHGTLSANSLSNNFCSSVNSCIPTSTAILSRLEFSSRHHVDMKRVRKKAMLVLSACINAEVNNFATHLTIPINMLCPMINLGPSRLK